MKVWETVVEGCPSPVRLEHESGVARDGLALFVGGVKVAQARGALFGSETDASGTWTGPDGVARHLRAWVGYGWVTGWAGRDCKLWVDGELVYEDDVFTRTASMVRSARRAFETAAR